MIKITNLTYTYPGNNTKALDKVNGHFEQGKIYAIVGKSGSGKSTLIQLLSGLDVAQEGSVVVDDKDLRGLDRDLYRSQYVGCVYQNHNLIDSMSVIDNIMMSLENSQYPTHDVKNRTQEILEYMGFPTNLHRVKISKLTSEETLRVAIARAIVHNPELILVDEPVFDIEETVIIDLLEKLKQYTQNHNRTLIITSRSRLIANYADTIWRMNEGCLTFIR